MFFNLFYKSLFISILTLTVLIGVTDNAFAQRDRTFGRGTGSDLCANEDPKVIVKLKTAKTKYYKNYSARSINEIHNTEGQGTILGLAGGPIEIAMNGKFSVRNRNNKACVELKYIEVTFWAKPVVIIASNFEKGTCEYHEVLAHEQKHIRTTRKFIREYAPKLRREVHRIVETSRQHIVVPDDRLEEGQKKIEEPIVKRLFAYQNSIFPVLRSRQKQIDTPEEYARVAAQCKNWGKKLAKN